MTLTGANQWGLMPPTPRVIIVGYDQSAHGRISIHEVRKEIAATRRKKICGSRSRGLLCHRAPHDLTTEMHAAKNMVGTLKFWPDGK